MSPQQKRSDSLAGKTVVVTGSSRGIGAATARLLASRGGNVIVHGRAASDSLDQVCQLNRQFGVDSIAVPCDFALTETLAGFVDACWNWKAGIDAWVHFAGADVLTTALKKEHWSKRMEALWQVDVSAAAILLTDLANRMKQQTVNTDRSVVTVGWDQAWHGMEGEAGLVFGTTKGAVMAMTLSLANNFAPHVRFNCVAPGWVKTAWGEAAGRAWQDRAGSESLLNRWASPEEVAEVAVFLAGSESRFLNGQIIPVNGGFRHGRPDLTQENRT